MGMSLSCSYGDICGPRNNDSRRQQNVNRKLPDERYMHTVFSHASYQDHTLSFFEEIRSSIVVVVSRRLQPKQQAS